MKDDPTFYALLVSIIYKADDNENIDEEKRKLANKVYSGFDKAKFCPTEKDGEVIYENLKKWIEKFKELLINQKQERLFGNLVGRLLAYSPIGEDGYSPCEAVRMVIEEYYTDSLKTAYVVAEENKRGVHMVDAGKSEIILHQRYQKNAEALQERYPYTADIYIRGVCKLIWFRFRHQIPCFIHSSRYILWTFLIKHLHYTINILQLI